MKKKAVMKGLGETLHYNLFDKLHIGGEPDMHIT